VVDDHDLVVGPGLVEHRAHDASHLVGPAEGRDENGGRRCRLRWDTHGAAGRRGQYRNVVRIADSTSSRFWAHASTSEVASGSAMATTFVPGRQRLTWAASSLPRSSQRRTTTSTFPRPSTSSNSGSAV